MFRTAAPIAVSLLCSAATVLAADEGAPTASEAAATSVRAGFVTLFEGDVAITRDDEGVPATGYSVYDGQRLKTGDGRAELTLTPGSLLRVGSHSEIEMIEGRIESATLRLLSGSIVADISSAGGGREAFIEAGDATFRFEKAGLYRVTHCADGTATIHVLTGRAIVAPVNASAKKGEYLSLDKSGAITRGRIAKAPDDPLVAWSKQRRKLIRRQGLPRPGAARPESVVDREVGHMETNRPVGTIVVGL